MAGKTEKTINVKITTGTIFHVLAVLVALFFLYQIRDIAAAVLLSVVIASGVDLAARWFQDKKIPRVPAVIITYLFVFAVLGVLFYLIVPTMFTELTALNVTLSHSLTKSFEFESLNNIIPGSAAYASAAFKEVAVRLTEYASQFAGGFFQLFVEIFGGAFSFGFVVVMSFYLSVQEKGIENLLRIIVPLKKEEYVIDLWQRTSRKIGLWFQGEILLGLIIGVLSYLGLLFLGVEYALVFALLAGVFELIPIFGPILSAVPPIVAALTHSPGLALSVALMYLVIQQFENHLIYPLVVKKVVGVPSILAILALVIGGKLGGIIGFLLAVPMATLLMEILNDIELRKHAHLAEETHAEL